MPLHFPVPALAPGRVAPNRGGDGAGPSAERGFRVGGAPR